MSYISDIDPVHVGSVCKVMRNHIRTHCRKEGTCTLNSLAM